MEKLDGSKDFMSDFVKNHRDIPIDMGVITNVVIPIAEVKYEYKCSLGHEVDKEQIIKRLLDYFDDQK